MNDFYLHAGATDGQAIFVSGGSNNVAAQSAVYGLPVAPCPADLDGDGIVGTSDLIVLLGNWGPCPK